MEETSGPGAGCTAGAGRGEEDRDVQYEWIAGGFKGFIEEEMKTG